MSERETHTGNMEQVKFSMLREFFNVLESADVRYCVVGDTGTLAAVLSSDVDIVVSGSDLSCIPALINHFCATNDCLLVQAIQHEQTATYYAIAIRSEGTPLYLHFDVCSDYYRHGRRLLSADEILIGNYRSQLGFRIPKQSAAFMYYLLKKIDKRALSAEQFQYLCWGWKASRSEAQEALLRFWNSHDVALLAAALDACDLDAITPWIPHLQRELRKGLPFSPADSARELRRLGLRIMRPTGLQVAVLGPDGSGKSSVINELNRSLAGAFRRTKGYHLRPHFCRPTTEGAPVTNPHASKERTLFGSLAKLLLWEFDYVTSYAGCLFPMIVQSTLVVFDRYAHDLLVDPRRYRYGGPRWLAKAFLRLVPPPDLIVILDAPAEIVRGRKEEVEVAESLRQRQEYLSLGRQLRNSHIVDSSRPLDQLATEVQDLVLQFLSERTARRLRLPETRPCA